MVPLLLIYMGSCNVLNLTLQPYLLLAFLVVLAPGKWILQIEGFAWAIHSLGGGFRFAVAIDENQEENAFLASCRF